MNEVLSLFPVLFVVYVLQCIAAAPPGCTVFLLRSGLRGRLLRSSWTVGRQQHRLFLLNPFFPSAGALYAEPFPFVPRFNASGELVALECLPSYAADGTAKVIPLEEGKPGLKRWEKKIHVGDERVVAMASEAAAKRVVKLVEELGKTPAKKRAALLKRELSKQFDAKSLAERLEKFVEASGLLRTICAALFLFVFFIAPVLVYFFALGLVWLPALVYLVVLSGTIVWLFRRAAKKLYPAKEDRPSQQTLTIGLSPFAAIRACHALVANVAAEFHPVTVARRVLEEKEFREFAGAELRRAKFLSRDAVMQELLSEFLEREKVRANELLRAPKPEGERVKTFCPACLAQYVVEAGSCKDCEGVELEKFGEKTSDQ